MRLYRANGIQRFQDAWREMQCDILSQPLIAVGQWQSQSTETKTRELVGAVLEYRLPITKEVLQAEVQPNLPWAEDHFQERVSGKPMNPPPSEQWWPFNQNKNAAHKMQKDGKVAEFSHTYPERFWPKFANEGNVRPNGRQVFVPHNGIRFEYGDLQDLVDLLRRAPGTRQAYLPVWFPEDTGTVHGERVPCTLGYHFLLRANRLHCWYYMRSCDLMRHFVDDVYMAGRLTQWICGNLADLGRVEPGTLTQVMSSLHTFEQDDYALGQARRLREGRR